MAVGKWKKDLILKAAAGPARRAPPQRVRPVFGQADRYRPGSW
jgi:hypothetical protein